jgi:predicted transposase/invertase (TIGR01784 family)
MSDVVNPHDVFFRETFSRKEVAASCLRRALPASITAKIDFNSLTIVKDSFVEKELRQHFSDILYTAQHQQGELYLYFLFEHKSFPDPWVSLQLLRYQVRIWEQYRKQHPKARSLPAIIPLVIYHGKKTWEMDNKFRSLINQDDQELALFIPNFEYLLHDLSAFSDKQVKGEVLERITMLLLKHIFDPDLVEKLPEILKLLQEVDRKENVLEILEVLLRYVVTATKKFDEDTLKEILKQSFIEEDVMQTFIDKYIEQGKKQGIQQGMHVILETQLNSRFGMLPEHAKIKLQTADEESIKKWSLKLLTAKTIDEIFH